MKKRKIRQVKRQLTPVRSGCPAIIPKSRLPRLRRPFLNVSAVCPIGLRIGDGMAHHGLNLLTNFFGVVLNQDDDASGIFLYQTDPLL